MDQPYVPYNRVLPEITIKAVILGIILAVLLAASTCYLGLKIGRTIAGSIPSAVIAMSIFSRFRNNNILENNITQTIASAGEVMACGAIFTLPALVMLGFWKNFYFWETVGIIITGGFLGIIFSIPLRRHFIVEKNLPYPEGRAAAEVLIVGASETHRGIQLLIKGGILSGFTCFLQNALKVVIEQWNYWFKVGTTTMGISFSLSPILLAAGYIVGLGVGAPILLGTIITWVIGVPVYGLTHGLPEGVPLADAAQQIYKDHLRYMGIGSMAVGGLWSMISILPAIGKAIGSAVQAMRGVRTVSDVRTEQDISMYIGLAIILLIGGVVFFASLKMLNIFMIHTNLYWILASMLVVMAIIIGFICSSIGAYLTGMLGSTALPVSGITLTAIIISASIFLFLLQHTTGLTITKEHLLTSSGIIIVLAAFIAIASAVSSDNMQDLKVGHIVGSTPWKQQAVLMIGVVAASLVVAPTLNLLLNVYGIGDVLPKTVTTTTHALLAPQATLMATITKGIFFQNLHWTMFFYGCWIAVAIIIIDSIAKVCKFKWRLPIMSVAGGMYLPMSYVFTFLIGGILQYFAKKACKVSNISIAKLEVAQQEQRGILIGAGVITGESLMGLVLAIPFAIYGSDEILMCKISPCMQTWLGFVLMGVIAWVLYAEGKKKS